MRTQKALCYGTKSLHHEAKMLEAWLRPETELDARDVDCQISRIVDADSLALRQ